MREGDRVEAAGLSGDLSDHGIDFAISSPPQQEAQVRILYGVTGEGMGHATRSKVVLSHLVEQHDLQVVVSGRAHAFLSRSFPALRVHPGFQVRAGTAGAQ